jgi:tripartite-type tricarboxylate transporter receptor subunit TctC
VPADIVQQINRDTRQILSDQDFRERMSGFGFIPSPESPAALAERIRADLERNGQSIRQAHIRVD